MSRTPRAASAIGAKFVRSRVITLSPIARFTAAAAVAAAGVAVRLALDPYWGTKLPFITLFPSIVVSAWLGGFWAGILTTVICAAAADYFWLPPVHSWGIAQSSDVAGLVLMVTIGAVVSALNEAWRRDASTAERTTAELRRQAQELELARAELAKASRLKDEFLAALSHELRTPLNAVLGYVHLLTTVALPADRARHALEAIQRNAQAQARLVESLLDLSRIVAGKLELDLQPADIGTLLDAAIAAVEPEADAKAIAIDLVVPPSVSRLYADGGRLQQVFWNLLSNAIKFTPPGGRVAIRVAEHDGRIAVAVADNGQGIPSEFLPHVFDRFKQAENPNRQQAMGLGLGLALVREMVQAHAGTVTAESPGEGQGSTFTVTLPLSPALEPSMRFAVEQATLRQEV